MKRYSYVLSLFLISPIVQASICDEAINYEYPEVFALREGFYLGLGTGLNAHNVKQETTAVVTMNPSLNVDGLVAGIYLGYGKFFSNLRPVYLGLEFFGYASGAESDFEALNSAGANYYSKVAIKNTLGLSLIPGYKINRNSMIYLRGSYIWSKINVNESVVSGSTVFDAETNTMTRGWGYGIGIESAFYDNFSWRLEYTHASLSNFTSEIASQIKPSANQFMLDLSYRFDL